MSDPVKSVEIEDVLSSIRRLLADGEQQATAPGPRPVDRPGQAAPSRVRSERRADAPLVLTPALRVAGRAEPQSQPPAQTASQSPAPTPFPTAARPGPETRDLRASDEDFEAPEIPQASSTQDRGLRSRLEATIAELEAAITHQVDEWEPDGSEPAPVMDWARAKAEDTPFLSRRHANIQTPARRDAPQPPEAEHAPVPEAGFHDGLAEDDGPQGAPEAAIAPAPIAQPGEAAPAPVEAPHAGAAEAVPLVDEEMLRRLIAEVLREELRGPLGDRITGNLRKLVRREIFRALASGEVD